MGFVVTMVALWGVFVITMVALLVSMSWDLHFGLCHEIRTFRLPYDSKYIPGVFDCRVRYRAPQVKNPAGNKQWLARLHRSMR